MSSDTPPIATPNAPAKPAAAKPAANAAQQLSTAIGIWLYLLALTGLTVLGSLVHFGHLAIVVCLGIASTKACLVGWHFMELKHEEPLVGRLFVGAFALIGILLIILLFDVWFR